MASINRVTIVGNLTRDPEIRQTSAGKSVCTLGIAVNDRYKNEAGEWVDKPNFFTVKVWGAQAESCNSYLSKGRQIAVDGRLDYQAWDAPDGTKRSKIEIVANTIQFLGSRAEAGAPVAAGMPSSDLRPDTSDFDSPAAVDDDDIPF